MVRCPIRVGVTVEHGATPEQGCRAWPARPCDCEAAGADRTGAQRRLDERMAPPAVHANGVSLTRGNDEHPL